MPLRDPLAQLTTTGVALGISASRLPSFGKGMFSVPGAWPLAYSAALRTSIRVVPRSGNLLPWVRDEQPVSR